VSIVSHPTNKNYRDNFDATFGKKEKPSSFAPYPADRPPRYNACNEPCDMWIGPCCCGAWHHGENDVLEKK
jgi:hypothetical protein